MAQVFTTICVLAVSLFLGPATAAAATPLVQATGPDGTVILNTQSGNITACASATELLLLNYPPYQEITPIGNCAKIGAISTASLSGNGFVSASYSTAYNNVVNGSPLVYGVAFVGNLETGVVLECTYEYDPQVGQVWGKCVTVANGVP